MNERIRLLPPNHYWGKRSGMYSATVEKSGYVKGWIFNGKRGGLGRGTPQHKQAKENQGDRAK